jgi:tetratricopeptide (TPR) repeat protein
MNAICIYLRTSYYKQRHLFHVGILALLIVMGYFTWARNNIYRSEVALWEDTVLKSPNKARCYNNLGFAYELEGRYREAKEAYICASDLDPDFILAKNNLRKVESILEDNR